MSGSVRTARPKTLPAPHATQSSVSAMSATAKPSARYQNPVLRPACASVRGCGPSHRARAKEWHARLNRWHHRTIRGHVRQLRMKDTLQHLEKRRAGNHVQYLRGISPAGSHGAVAVKVGQFGSEELLSRILLFRPSVYHSSPGRAAVTHAARLARSPCTSFTWGRTDLLEPVCPHVIVAVDLLRLDLSCNPCRRRCYTLASI